MVCTNRTYPIAVTRDDDGTFQATENGSTYSGTGDTPMDAIIDYAERCKQASSQVEA